MATDSLSRAEKTLRTRQRMLGSARRHFLEHGFAATTVAQIAAGADVAEQTIYYTFGTKGRLLIEVVESSAAGYDDPEPVPERAWFKEMLSAPTGQGVLALDVEHGMAIYERVADLWPAINAAAATDGEVAEYWAGVAVGKRKGAEAILERIVELGELRPGLDQATATEILYVLSGHDVYRSFVLDARWPVPEYRAWLFATLVQQLLGAQEPDPAVLRGVSVAVETT